MVSNNVNGVKFFPKRGVAITLSAFLLPCSTLSSPETLLLHEVIEVREGDLLFRAGRGWRSAIVRSASNSMLTHVGVVDLAEEGQAYVIHAAPAEGKQEGKVRRQSLREFVGQESASALIVYRPNLEEASLRRAVRAAEGYAKSGISFDDDFNLASDDALYCTELIWKAFLDAGVDLQLIRTEVTFPGMTGEYIFPEDIMSMIPGEKISFHPIGDHYEGIGV